jgi:glycosyltransferase involved in cell wall biosynthesis
MLCGLPVITTEAAGSAQDMIISGENGFVVSDADSEQLCVALNKIVSDSCLATQMGANSLRIVQTKFNIDQRIQGFISAIGYCLR